jgi:DNA-binding transcriptional LysR family regulator
MILSERIHRLLILAEELHFGRAAERLHVSQPALSGSLKSLESELGARLFKRTSRNVELTEAGNILASEARRMLQESERTTALVRECQSDLSGPRYIGYCSALDLQWLGGLMSKARRDGFRDAEWQFVSCDASRLQEGLDKRTLHAAFFAGFLRRAGQSDFQYVRLFRENLQAVLAAGRRLARSGAIGIRDLQDEPVVWLRHDADTPLHDGFVEMCSSQGYWPKVVQEAGTFYECLQFAREGIGITFLPSCMSAPADANVVFLGLAGALHIDYTLIYRRNTKADDAMDRFVAFVRDHAAAKRRGFVTARERCPSIRVPDRSERTND